MLYTIVGSDTLTVEVPSLWQDNRGLRHPSVRKGVASTSRCGRVFKEDCIGLSSPDGAHQSVYPNNAPPLSEINHNHTRLTFDLSSDRRMTDEIELLALLAAIRRENSTATNLVHPDGPAH